jgi:hypothetical protein
MVKQCVSSCWPEAGHGGRQPRWPRGARLRLPTTLQHRYVSLADDRNGALCPLARKVAVIADTILYLRVTHLGDR